MKVIITGASGMVGKGVLLECLESSQVEKVLTVNRGPLGISHPKHREVLVRDFFDLRDIEKELAGYDACFFCAGTTAVGKTEEEYYRITYDLTLHFAQTFLKQNAYPALSSPSGSIGDLNLKTADSLPAGRQGRLKSCGNDEDFISPRTFPCRFNEKPAGNDNLGRVSCSLTFCYVTGQGTDSTEKGRAMWARVKGKTENALLRLPFKGVYLFRPWYIQPLKGIQSKTEIYEMFYAIFRPVYAVLKNFPSTATDTTRLGRAMIYAALHLPPEKILHSREINGFSGELK